MSSTTHNLVKKSNIALPEKVGGIVVCGDCIEWVAQVSDESVDLCYIDPPFFSNRDYEIIWGNGSEVRSFGDRFAGGVQHYVDWMRDRVKLIWQKIKPTGTMFLHCDWHASARLRVMLEELEGCRFQSEIIWKRTGAKGLASSSLPNNHDTILFVSKSKEYKFNRPYKPHNLDYVETAYRSVEQGTGRRYQADNLLNPNKNRPNLTYVWNGHNRVWRWTKERMAEADKNGLLVYTKNGLARQKRYLDEMKGIPLDTVWDDIGALQSQSKERIGYPTQKPVQLVKRIIEMCTEPGDVVLDCFGGGGTTAVACVETRRRFITGDVSPVAVKIMSDRLKQSSVKVPYEVKNISRTADEFKKMNGNSFAELVCEVKGWKLSTKKSGDGGIDGWDGQGYAVQIKNHSTAATGRPDLQRFASAIRSVKGKNNRGVFVSWAFSKEAREYVALIKQNESIQIELIECSLIFGSLILPQEKAEEITVLYNNRKPIKWGDEDTTAVVKKAKSKSDLEELNKINKEASSTKKEINKLKEKMQKNNKNKIAVNIKAKSK